MENDDQTNNTSGAEQGDQKEETNAGDNVSNTASDAAAETASDEVKDGTNAGDDNADLGVKEPDAATAEVAETAEETKADAVAEEEVSGQ